jgi:hypothetical protein
MTASPPMRVSRSASLVIGATVVAGLGGYIITAVAARGLGEGYAPFAIFWASLYLIVGTFAGVQQEIARGSLPRTEKTSFSGRALVSVVALVAAVIVAVASLIFVAVGATLDSNLGLPLVLGATLSVAVAAISGLYLGQHSWRLLAAVIVGDVALRLAFVLLVLALGGQTTALAWACIAPFPLLVLANIFILISRGQFRAVLDVPYAKARNNLARTVLASFGTAMLVSGFPLAMAMASSSPTTALGPLIFALTLTRAPLVVGTLALQGYLVVFFRDSLGRTSRKVFIFFGAILGGGLLLAIAAWAWGQQIIVAVAGSLFTLDGSYLALLTLSSVPTAWLAVAGASVLATGRHTQYTLGWLGGALSAMAILFIPGDVNVQLLLALAIGPLVGVAIHLLPVVKSP